MARIFVSSTVRDLKDHREAVYVALRRLGHQSVAMEQWAASDQAPVERSLEAVRNSDLVVVIVAWRYGWIPQGQQYSTTELELRAARDAAIPSLIFIVPEDAPWPQADVDDDPTYIRRFRQSLLEQYVVGFFSTPEELASQVAVALHSWIASRAPAPSLAGQEAVRVEETPGPDVFLSYAHEDVAVAESLSDRIVQERWSVFWDREIPVGLTWDDIVEGR